jgi:hypothetical protein
MVAALESQPAKRTAVPDTYFVPGRMCHFGMFQLSSPNTLLGPTRVQHGKSQRISSKKNKPETELFPSTLFQNSQLTGYLNLTHSNNHNNSHTSADGPAT